MLTCSSHLNDGPWSVSSSPWLMYIHLAMDATLNTRPTITFLASELHHIFDYYQIILFGARGECPGSSHESRVAEVKPLSLSYKSCILNIAPPHHKLYDNIADM